MTAYLLERAWIDGAVRSDVLVRVADGVITAVDASQGTVGNRHFPGDAPPGKWMDHTGPWETDRVPGLTIPGLANTHSHAFHRALRGRTQRGEGTFWSWREQMYDVAARLDPDTCFRIARATYREMAAAGITTVGEFHYLRHQPGGTPYADPNAMAIAHVEAAREAGIRIALLDTAYLAAGIGEPPTGVQRRFADADAEAFAARSSRLDALVAEDVVVGTAIHSVRAVPRDQLAPIAALRPDAPLHMHVSEQPAENEQCRAAYDRTPTALLAEAGALGPRSSAVHATHLTGDDVRVLGESGTYVALCPTTERDLGDGIGPGRRLHEAGARLTLGSDSQAVIDPFEEMRAVEMHERLVTRRRGHWRAAELLAAATHDGHASLGFPRTGRIAVGYAADLVTIDTSSPRTAGTGADEQTAVFAATAQDVVQVIVGGRVVARAHDRPGIGAELDAAIAEVWRPR